jgi:hypothetical protein
MLEMKTIVSTIASGGTLLKLCEDTGESYSDTVAWILESYERTALFQRAMVAKSYWAIDAVLDELKAIATVDPKDIYTDAGTLRDVSDMPPSVRKAIDTIKSEEIMSGGSFAGYTKSVSFHDKIRALELIGRKFAMFIDRSRVEEKKDIEALIEESAREDIGTVSTVRETIETIGTTETKEIANDPTKE